MKLSFKYGLLCLAALSISCVGPNSSLPLKKGGDADSESQVSNSRGSKADPEPSVIEKSEKEMESAMVNEPIMIGGGFLACAYDSDLSTDLEVGYGCSVFKDHTFKETVPLPDDMGISSSQIVHSEGTFAMTEMNRMEVDSKWQWRGGIEKALFQTSPSSMDEMLAETPDLSLDATFVSSEFSTGTFQAIVPLRARMPAPLALMGENVATHSYRLQFADTDRCVGGDPVWRKEVVITPPAEEAPETPAETPETPAETPEQTPANPDTGETPAPDTMEEEVAEQPEVTETVNYIVEQSRASNCQSALTINFIPEGDGLYRLSTPLVEEGPECVMAGLCSKSCLDFSQLGYGLGGFFGCGMGTQLVEVEFEAVEGMEPTAMFKTQSGAYLGTHLGHRVGLLFKKENAKRFRLQAVDL